MSSTTRANVAVSNETLPPRNNTVSDQATRPDSYNLRADCYVDKNVGRLRERMSPVLF